MPAPYAETWGWAEAAARRGWSVVPLHNVTPAGCTCRRADCPSPGKHPRVPWERWQRERPAEATLLRWWRRWPDANVGVLTGTVSGLIVVDVDPRNGGQGSLSDVEAAYGRLPATVECLTGGGGRHVYLRHPGRPVPSRPVAPGLDLKGDGGLVVAPPSRHSSGRAYRWAPGRSPEDVAVAPAPSWLLAMGVPAWTSTGDGGRVAVPRTPAERVEFARLWATLGVDLVPGDHSYLCPFHDDHHPSLHIDAEGCRWLCFGCRRGGGLGRLRRLVQTGPPPGTAPPLVPVTLAGGATVEVVGESHHQDALLAVAGGRRRYSGVNLDVVAHLVPEPGNPSDPAAIAVLIAGRKVGYLTRSDGSRLRAAVDDAIATFGEATCVATVCGGWERPGQLGWFGVKLWVGGRITRTGTTSSASPAGPDLLLRGGAGPGGPRTPRSPPPPGG